MSAICSRRLLFFQIPRRQHLAAACQNLNIMNDRLTYEEKKELPDSVFGLPERREYPMPDAAHVRAAEAYFRYCPEELKPRLAKAILQRAREYGVDVESPTVLSYAEK